RWHRRTRNEGESIYLRLVPYAGGGDEMVSSSSRSVPEHLPPVLKPDGRSEHERKLAEFGNRIQGSLQRMPRSNCSPDRRRCEVTVEAGEAATKEDWAMTDRHERIRDALAKENSNE